MQKNNFFKGKNVLITGSVVELFPQVAKDFLDLGCYVAVHYNSNKKGLIKF